MKQPQNRRQPDNGCPPEPEETVAEENLRLQNRLVDQGHHINGLYAKLEKFPVSITRYYCNPIKDATSIDGLIQTERDLSLALQVVQKHLQIFLSYSRT